MKEAANETLGATDDEGSDDDAIEDAPAKNFNAFMLFDDGELRKSRKKSWKHNGNEEKI